MSGHIYVVELPGGIVKVGRSAHRFDRLAHYAKADDELLSWISPRFVGYRGAETSLIHALGARFPAVPGTRETFAVDFRWAVGVARSVVRAVMLDNAFAA